MTSKKRRNEKDSRYLERRLPEVHDALVRIEGFSEARRELFDDATIYWEGDPEADLTNKTMLGLVQLEIEDLREQMETMEDRLGRKENMEEEWHIFGKEENAVIFANDAGELHRIPTDLLDIIVNLKSFDGEIRSDGRFVKYEKDGRTLCRVPKGLVRNLAGKHKSAKSLKDEEGGD